MNRNQKTTVKAIGILFGACILLYIIWKLLPLLFFSGAIGIWYFSKKKPNKLYQKISIALTMISFLGMVVLPNPIKTSKTSETVVQTDSTKKKQATASSSSAADESSEVTETPISETAYRPNSNGTIAPKNKSQLFLGELDHLQRATYAHIQLTAADQPTEKRASKLEYDPVRLAQLQLLL